MINQVIVLSAMEESKISPASESGGSIVSTINQKFDDDQIKDAESEVDHFLELEMGPEHPSQIGIEYCPYRSQFKATIFCDDVDCTVGYFDSLSAAQLARDAQVFSIFFTDSEPLLNTRYHVLHTFFKNSMENIVVTACKDLSYVVWKSDFRSLESLVNNRIKNVVGFNSTHYADLSNSIISSPSFPSKTDNNRKWVDRLSGSHLPSAAFCYEITFNHQNPLGLNLRPHLLPYSSGSGRRSLGCCVVIDASPLLSPVIASGDILLKVNDISLLSSSTDGFNFEATTRCITTAQAPRTIRFMRVAGSCHNVIPSPAEVMLLAAETTQPIAKFSVGMSSSALSSSLNNMPITAPITLQLLNMDSQVLVYLSIFFFFSFFISILLLFYCYFIHYLMDWCDICLCLDSCGYSKSNARTKSSLGKLPFKQCLCRLRNLLLLLDYQYSTTSCFWQ